MHIAGIFWIKLKIIEILSIHLKCNFTSLGFRSHRLVIRSLDFTQLVLSDCNLLKLIFLPVIYTMQSERTSYVNRGNKLQSVWQSQLLGAFRQRSECFPSSAWKPEILRLFERMSSVNRRNEWQSKGTLCVNGQNELRLIKIFFPI